MGFEQILSEVRGRVGIVILNQPDKLNAMSGVMQAELSQQIATWNADDSVGAIVITGAGRAFCSGADISNFEDVIQGGHGNAPSRSNDQDWIQLVKESKPIICAINGVAVGLGITLLLPCDIRVASEDARISFRFVRIGLTPEYASTHYLVSLIGIGRAMELMLTGKFVQADEAKDLGLVSHVYPAETMLDEAVFLAQGIADSPTWQLQSVKRLIHENYLEKDISWVLKRERETFRQAQTTAEHAEALTAFRERREPKFH